MSKSHLWDYSVIYYDRHPLISITFPPPSEEAVAAFKKAWSAQIQTVVYTCCTWVSLDPVVSGVPVGLPERP